MAERETKEITTPLGHKVVLRSYLTGREANDLKSVMFSALKMNMEDAQSGKVNVGEVSGSFLIEQEQRAMALLVVSIDGDTNDPLKTLLDDLPSTEYDFVKKEVDAITNPTTPQSSAQPGAGTSVAA